MRFLILCLALACADILPRPIKIQHKYCSQRWRCEENPEHFGEQQWRLPDLFVSSCPDECPECHANTVIEPRRHDLIDMEIIQLSRRSSKKERMDAHRAISQQKRSKKAEKCCCGLRTIETPCAEESDSD